MILKAINSVIESVGRNKQRLLFLLLLIILVSGMAIMRFAGPGRTVVKKIRGVDFAMLLIPGGTFYRGSDAEQAYEMEQPVHSVRLESFYLGRHEVTEEQWQAVMGRPPRAARGQQYPVLGVSWLEVSSFIKELNRLSGKRFRLPSEAEWEYAARGGTRAERYGELAEIAWYDDNSENSPQPVGLKQANAYGLYDMLGNAWEWVQDWYGLYETKPQIDPRGPLSGSFRVYRGASWQDPAEFCRVSFRLWNAPQRGRGNLGFRLAADLDRSPLQRGLARKNDLRVELRLLRDCNQALEINPHEATALAERSTVLRQLGFRRRARMDLMRLVKIEPEFVWEYYARAERKMELGDNPGALHDLDRVISNYPDHLPTLLLRGRVHFQLKNLPAALEDFTRVIETEPEGFEAYLYRARIKLKLKDRQSGRRDLEKALAIHPELAEALQFKMPIMQGLSIAVSFFIALYCYISLRPKTADFIYRKGLKLGAAGNSRGAARAFTWTILLVPGHREALVFRAGLRSDLGDYQGAIRDYSRAIALEPDQAIDYYERGLSRSRAGDHRGAWLDYSRAIELDPGLSKAYINRGLAREELNDLAGAIRDLNRAIEIEPDCPRAYCNRSYVYQRRKDFQAALEDLDRAIALDPDYVRTIMGDGA